VSARTHPPGPEPIADFLRPLFWDCDPNQLDWTRHETYLIERILRHGTWDQVKWLRARSATPASPPGWKSAAARG
jgi:hypothetical protein